MCPISETTGASTSAAVPRPRSLLEALQDLPEEERENLLEQLKRIMTREAIAEIERLTRAQASSSHWMLYRRGMATASICRGFFTRAKSLKTQPRPHNLRGLLDKVLQVSTFQSASMKRGQQKEGTAKEKYLSKLVTDGHCPRIENSGLVIWEQMPIMGGSPDGIVVFECECCRGKRVLLEVKCPEVLQNSFCQKTGEPQYVYYTQMQKWRPHKLDKSLVTKLVDKEALVDHYLLVRVCAVMTRMDVNIGSPTTPYWQCHGAVAIVPCSSIPEASKGEQATMAIAS
ncbi:hypothetical protein HPB47_005821 [Ixodes persulcatus]|uniref:Uncharacterized protein n=1 Tax=Ixodes persulcatus TaxID=34615 RepID=A0AC60PCI8_IXOPE|nr:hypothetical protein HPB47_005821 [Ixodes persulcatus]